MAALLTMACPLFLSDSFNCLSQLPPISDPKTSEVVTNMLTITEFSLKEKDVNLLSITWGGELAVRKTGGLA